MTLKVVWMRLIRLALIASVVVVKFVDSYDSSVATWQSCDTFMSPDVGHPSRGWAVYAARSFKRGEIVELTPLFIPMPHSVTRHSVLDHYIFSFDKEKDMNMVLFGMGAFFNYSPDPNVRLVEVMTPDRGDDVPHLVGFTATRDIQAGEQLFISYGDTPDAGNEWFEKRGLEVKLPSADSAQVEIDSSLLPLFQKKYCSNIYAGIGKQTWNDKILPILNNQSSMGDQSWRLQGGSKLATFDAGLSDVRSKKDIKKGQLIETSVGLVLSRNHIRGTPLGVLAFYWENMKVDHHQALINLRDDDRLFLQYQGYDTNWESVDRFAGYAEMTVLPIGGYVGMIRRVQGGGILVEDSSDADSDSTPNCKLIIRSNKEHHIPVGVTLELVALTDISAGDVLKLNISPSGFPEEYQLLQKEMDRTGQPHHPSVYDYVPFQGEEL